MVLPVGTDGPLGHAGTPKLGLSDYVANWGLNRPVSMCYYHDINQRPFTKVTAVKLPSNFDLADVLIRPPEPRDIDALYAIHVHRDVGRTTLSLPSAEREYTKQWLHGEVDGRHRLIADWHGRAIGSVGLRMNTQPRQANGAELGLVIDPEFWRAGVASKLMSAILHIADQWLGLERIVLQVFTENLSAVGLYEKFGFVIEGTHSNVVFSDGRWQAEHVMVRYRHTKAGHGMASWPQLTIKPVAAVSPLNIRPVAPEDAHAIHQIWQHPMVARNLLTLPTIEYQRVVEWCAQPIPDLFRFVGELDGQVVGIVTLHATGRARMRHVGRLELAVAPAYWGSGIGQKLLNHMVGYADDWLNLVRLYGSVQVGDESGRAFHILKKAGFKLYGSHPKHTLTDGKLCEVVELARIRAGYQIDPPPRNELRSALPAADQYKLRVNPKLKNCHVRVIEDQDAAGLTILFTDPSVGRTTAQHPAQERGHIDRRIFEHSRARHRFVAELDGKVVGLCNIGVYSNPRRRHAGTLGMSVHPDYWGRGIGTQLLSTLVDLADNWLGLTRLELEVTVDNPAGIRLYEKFGFIHESNLPYHLYGGGRWAHSLGMGRLKT